MTRLQLNWLGIKASPVDSGNAFRTIIIVIITYYTLTILWSFMFPGEYYENDNGTYDHYEDPVGQLLLYILKGVFAIWSTVILLRTRRALREKYEIPEERCHGFEDLVCSVFCSPCAVAQMARHTADYENYGAMCCTEDGLTENTPMDPVAIAGKIELVNTEGIGENKPQLV